MRRDVYAVILAGGRGERFWPLSTEGRPKQLIPLVGGRPLLAAAVDLVDGLVPRENVFVITGAQLVESCAEIAPSVPAANIVGEPVGRDTAAAITLGAALVKARDPASVFCVLTADHVVGDRAVFAATLESAVDMAASDFLVTIGMRPSWAHTGFGYIEAGERLPAAGRVEFFKARRFVEKPDANTAAGFLEAGNYYWNSGMFIWSLKAFERALAEHCPSLAGMLKSLVPVIAGGRLRKALGPIYPRLERISIDYALMEKAGNVIMAKGEFEWDDVGTWAALEDHLEKDAAANAVSGAVESLDSSGNVVVAEQGMVALCGVRDMIVVRTGKATLVCPKNRAQDVKRLVELLREKGSYDEVL